MFRAGSLEDIRDDDPTFETFDEALSYADKKANDAESFDYQAFAVWDAESGECLAIAFQSQIFTP